GEAIRGAAARTPTSDLEDPQRTPTSSDNPSAGAFVLPENTPRARVWCTQTVRSAAVSARPSALSAHPPCNSNLALADPMPHMMARPESQPSLDTSHATACHSAEDVAVCIGVH